MPATINIDIRLLGRPVVVAATKAIHPPARALLRAVQAAGLGGRVEAVEGFPEDEPSEALVADDALVEALAEVATRRHGRAMRRRAAACAMALIVAWVRDLQTEHAQEQMDARQEAGPAPPAITRQPLPGLLVALDQVREADLGQAVRALVLGTRCMASDLRQVVVGVETALDEERRVARGQPCVVRVRREDAARLDAFGMGGTTKESIHVQVDDEPASLLVGDVLLLRSICEAQQGGTVLKVQPKDRERVRRFGGHDEWDLGLEVQEGAVTTARRIVVVVG